MKKASNIFSIIIISLTGVLICTMIFDIVQQDYLHAACNAIWIFQSFSLVFIMKQKDELMEELRDLDDLNDRLRDKIKEMEDNENKKEHGTA